MTQSVAQRYLRLGLQLGRHVEGIVDAYCGPPEPAAAVEAAPPVNPRTLVAAAEALLDELEDGWLHDQVVGLRTYAGVLAGESASYADEVEGMLRRAADLHRGSPLHSRARAARGAAPRRRAAGAAVRALANSILVPTEQVERTVAAAIEEARTWTRGLVELPAGEGVVLEIVRDKPWLASCDYLGDLRSRIAVNVDLPMSAIELLRLTIHETYPGHHAERSSKEHLLVRGRGLLEETLVLVPTPQSLVSEGVAELAPYVLHDAGASKAEVHAYLERWGLMTPKLAAQMIRFLTEPTSRTYVITYPAGRELCRSYVAGDPERFHRLLTEQVRVRDLLGAVASLDISTPPRCSPWCRSSGLGSQVLDPSATAPEVGAGVPRSKWNLRAIGMSLPTSGTCSTVGTVQAH